jgi:hypothetical protein
VRDGIAHTGEAGMHGVPGPGSPHLPAGAAQRLVDHDARVGHAVAFALRARAQQERPHGRGQAKAVRLHVRAAQLRSGGPTLFQPSVHTQSPGITLLGHAGSRASAHFMATMRTPAWHHRCPCRP